MKTNKENRFTVKLSNSELQILDKMKSINNTDSSKYIRELIKEDYKNYIAVIDNISE